MMKTQRFMQEHKVIAGLIGFIFIIVLECFVFPVCNLSHSVKVMIGFINFFTALGICKCAGEIEFLMFPNWKWWMILLLNLGVTVLGMLARYLLEYGEVSNIYNFTIRNILFHVLVMVLWSSVFWLRNQRGKEPKLE